ncbi:MAG TPA: hypothetical protein VN637_13620 [Roseiarcus sp.]|nr:hypothetical protein [Roseiarcus sp.]
MASRAWATFRNGHEVRIEVTGSAYDRLRDGSHRSGGDKAPLE